MKKLILFFALMCFSSLAFADSKLSALSSNSSPSTTDLTYDVASGTSYKITLGQVNALMAASANTYSALQTFGTNISIGGVTATGATGTGNNVFATSPTLVTPILGTPQSVTLNNTSDVFGGVTMTLGSDASYDTYYRNSSGVLTRLANGTTGQSLTATSSAAPSWSFQPTYNILNYGAKADAKTYTTGFCTSGSTTFTDATDAPFVSGDTGKTIVLKGCGAGSNNNGRGSYTITAITSNSGKAQLALSEARFSVDPINGQYVWIEVGTTTGGTPAAGGYYLGSLTNVSGTGYNSSWTAILYTNAALTTPVSYSATGTGIMEGGPVDLVTTITYNSSASVTLGTAAGTTLTNVASYYYGTNNATSIANAISAAGTTGSVVYVPSGNYLVDSASVMPTTTGTLTTSNSAINGASNLRFVGDGWGKSIITRASEGGSIFSGSGNNWEVSDMTLQYAFNSMRNPFTFSNLGIVTSITGSAVNHARIKRVEINNADVNAASIIDNATDVEISDSIVHNSLGNGYLIACYAGGDVVRSGLVNDKSYNTSDAAVSDDSLSGCNVRNAYITGGEYYNTGANGIEITGGIGLNVTGVTVDTTTNACMRVFTNPGYSNTSDTNITGVFLKGCGANTSGGQPGENDVVGGLDIYTTSSTGTVSNTHATGIHVGPSGVNGAQGVGPYVAVFTESGNAGTVSGVHITDVHGDGGSAAIGAGQNNTYTPRMAGIEVQNASGGTIKDVQVDGAYLNTTYEDGVYVSSGVTGNVLVGDVSLDSPNSSSTSSVYGMNINGGSNASYDNIQVYNAPGTWGGNVYCPSCVWSNYGNIGQGISSAVTPLEVTGLPKAYTSVAGTTLDTGILGFSTITSKTPSGNLAQIMADMSIALSGSQTYTMYGINSAPVITSSDSATYTGSIYGGAYTPTYNGSGSITGEWGLYVGAIKNGTGTASNLGALTDILYIPGTSVSTISSLYGIQLNSPNISSNNTTITNAYQLYLAAMNPGTGTFTNTPYAIYQASTTDKIYWGSKFTTYNNISTVSNGVPSELGTVDLTAQAAAITATTLYTPAASQSFRISASVQVTQAATSSSILGGTTGLVITYTEPDGSVAQSVTMALQNKSGAVVVPATGDTGNSTTTQDNGVIVIRAKSGTAIQYAIGYTSVGGTAMNYALHLKCEAL